MISREKLAGGGHCPRRPKNTESVMPIGGQNLALIGRHGIPPSQGADQWRTEADATVTQGGVDSTRMRRTGPAAVAHPNRGSCVWLQSRRHLEDRCRPSWVADLGRRDDRTPIGPEVIVVSAGVAAGQLVREEDGVRGA